MARKTRKHTKSTKGIYSIPELRRAFEHVEETMDEMIRNKESKADMISHIRKEWLKVFHKTLDKSSADALITHRMESRRTPHSMKGGAQVALAGAPVEHITRAGVYLDQGDIPRADGGLTTTVGGGFGHYPQYVDRRFFNPEIARGYDPVPNQSSYPLPRDGMGSNAFTPLNGGKRKIKTRKNKKTRGGAAAFDQAFMHPFSPGAGPSDPLVDLQRMSSGAVTGPSPDSTANSPQYRVGSVYPSAVNISV